MKRDPIVTLLLLTVVGMTIYFVAWPQGRALYARIRTPRRVVTGTASKGNDSGGVLTGSENVRTARTGTPNPIVPGTGKSKRR